MGTRGLGSRSGCAPRSLPVPLWTGASTRPPRSSASQTNSAPLESETWITRGPAVPWRNRPDTSDISEDVRRYMEDRIAGERRERERAAPPTCSASHPLLSSARRTPRAPRPPASPPPIGRSVSEISERSRRFRTRVSSASRGHNCLIPMGVACSVQVAALAGSGLAHCVRERSMPGGRAWAGVWCVPVGLSPPASI